MIPSLVSFDAIVFDVDRTLLNLHQELPVGLEDELRLLANKGIRLAISTGRGLQLVNWTILKLFDNLTTSSSHILNNGALIIDKLHHPIIDHPIPSELVKQILSDVNHDSKLVLSTLDTTYVSHAFLKIAPQYTQYSKGNIRPISAYHFEPAYLINIKELYPKEIMSYSWSKQLSLFFLTPDNMMPSCDITAKGISKGSCLREWAKLNQIPLAKVAVVGDSNNDLPMFAEAGFKIAMGNSEDSVKSQADLVIGHVDQGGLPQFLHRWQES